MVNFRKVLFVSVDVPLSSDYNTLEYHIVSFCIGVCDEARFGMKVLLVL